MRACDRRLLRLEGLDVDCALLLRRPALVDQRSVAIPGHLRQHQVSFGLLLHGFQLNQGRLVLRDLMLELRRGNLGEQLPLLHMIADIHVAFADVAARARVNVRGLKRQRRGRQGYRLDRIARLHGGHPHLRNSIAFLFGGRHHLAIVRIVARRPERERSDGNETDRESDQEPAPAVAGSGAHGPRNRRFQAVYVAEVIHRSILRIRLERVCHRFSSGVLQTNRGPPATWSGSQTRGRQ